MPPRPPHERIICRQQRRHGGLPFGVSHVKTPSPLSVTAALAMSRVFFTHHHYNYHHPPPPPHPSYMVNMMMMMRWVVGLTGSWPFCTWQNQSHHGVGCPSTPIYVYKIESFFSFPLSFACPRQLFNQPFLFLSFFFFFFQALNNAFSHALSNVMNSVKDKHKNIWFLS